MNNDLEQFSEERLINMERALSIGSLDDRPTMDEILKITRMALAAKQAKSSALDRTNAFTDEDLEGMAHGNNPVANAYRELLAFRRAAKQEPTGYLENGKGFMYEPRHKDLIKNPTPVYTTPQLAHTEQVNAPMQPLHIDEFGTIRFKANAIVQHLLDMAGIVGVNMNTIAMQGFEPEDQMHFSQLIGYSLSGYGELSYVTDESYERASAAAPKPESE